MAVFFHFDLCNHKDIIRCHDTPGERSQRSTQKRRLDGRGRYRSIVAAVTVGLHFDINKRIVNISRIKHTDRYETTLTTL